MSYRHIEDWTAERNGWKLVGTMGVDAGLCWIGDPCYIIHADSIAKSLGKNWSEFCDTLLDPEGGPHSMLEHKSYDFEMGHEGLGVVVGTGHGDGSYPVYAQIVDGRCMRVLADFDEAEDNTCDSCGYDPCECEDDADEDDDDE